MMTSQRRWLKSVLKTAQAPAPRLPWERVPPAKPAQPVALAAR